eukprot:TRINITY_DN27521_c0_g1_i1.p1 TRINITY_DN27521_c0_g1~~TRINITY_DN27521_c0_g1_i1.p1  ORF type:complete len:516 (-),score=102.96 TRINITY_DN27521_c0_g1_i1:233-1780(-)
MAATTTEISNRCSSEEADRLAAFAVGCLGAQSVAAVGKRLGLMGSATLEEMRSVLRHLEVLHLQRAAKLAGCCPPAVGVDDGRGIGQPFEAELLAAVRSNSISELFERLPLDSSGRADLCFVFGLSAVEAASKPGNDARDPLCIQDAKANGIEFPADFVEQASALPEASVALAVRASRFLVDAAGQPADERWEADASAINALRSATARRASAEAAGGVKISEEETLSISPDLLREVASRCSSRRPALAKAALCAIAEFVEVNDGKLFGGDSLWASGGCASGAAEEAIAACLAALRGTKVAARLAEQSLACVTRRVAAETSPAAAAVSVVACTLAVVRAKPPQPSSVVGGLRTLTQLLSGLVSVPGWACHSAVASAQSDVRRLCEEVAASPRALGACVAPARALLRALPDTVTSTIESATADDVPAVIATRSSAAPSQPVDIASASPTASSLSSTKPVATATSVADRGAPSPLAKAAAAARARAAAAARSAKSPKDGGSERAVSNPPIATSEGMTA